LTVAATVASPEPPASAKKDKKAEKPRKPPVFPLSMFTMEEEAYANPRTCRSCHRTAVGTFDRSYHAVFMQDPKLPLDKQGCQACHGPSAQHVQHLTIENGLFQNIISYRHNVLKPEQVAAVCLRCHQDTITENHWRFSAHARAGVACNKCHQIHRADRLDRNEIEFLPPERELTPQMMNLPKNVAPDPVSIRPIHDPLFSDSQIPKSSLKTDETKLCGECHRRQLAEFRHNFHHPVPEGRMVCSDCHDVHNNRDDRKKVRTSKQSCVTCHAEIAGPFVYEHDPVSDLTGQGCLECHRSHGSPNPMMLNSFSRGLCTQCHTEQAINHNPGRSCFDTGCHSAVHGSNHDPFLLSR
jgi:predicted CXXCH cytochrome family protein